MITTVVGDAAGLNAPRGLAFDGTGNLYIADSGNHQIRLRNAAGVVSVIAGSGRAGFNGDGGTALAADFDTPVAVAVDRSGNLFIADQNNHRVSKLVPASAPAGVDETLARLAPTTFASTSQFTVPMPAHRVPKVRSMPFQS